MTKNKVHIIAFIMTYLLTRLIFYIVGFEYSIFDEGINVIKLLLDFMTWIIIFVTISYCLKRIFRIKD